MRMIPRGLLIVASCGLAACINSADDSAPAEDIEIDSAAASANPDSNGLDSYKVVHAPIFVKQTIASHLLGHPLRTGALTSDVVDAICNDGLSGEAFSYVVRCALPSNTNVSVTCGGRTTTYSGKIGLANAWGVQNGSCTTADCREWVSACALAHSNFSGQMGVPIQIGASSPSLTVTHNTTYPNDEGAYWGDIFNEDGKGVKRYGCYGSNANATYTVGSTKYKLMSRICGYYDIGGVCKTCTSISTDVNNLCAGTNQDYLANFGDKASVRSCAKLCATDAGTNGGFYSNCTTNGSGTASSRVVTVWRK